MEQIKNLQGQSIIRATIALEQKGSHQTVLFELTPFSSCSVCSSAISGQSWKGPCDVLLDTFVCRAALAAILSQQESNIFLKLVTSITSVISGMKEIKKGQGFSVDSLGRHVEFLK